MLAPVVLLALDGAVSRQITPATLFRGHVHRLLALAPRADGHGREVERVLARARRLRRVASHACHLEVRRAQLRGARTRAGVADEVEVEVRARRLEVRPARRVLLGHPRWFVAELAVPLLRVLDAGVVEPDELARKAIDFWRTHACAGQLETQIDFGAPLVFTEAIVG